MDRLVVARNKTSGGMEREGGYAIQASIYGMDEQWGPAGWPRKLHWISCDKSLWKIILKNVYTQTHTHTPVHS